MFNIDVKKQISQTFEKAQPILAKAILPIILEKQKKRVQEAIDGLVEGQSVANEYSIRYEINNREAIGHITVILGPISGSMDVVAGGSKTKTHTRSYDGQRPFKLPDGSWVTLSHIPAELAIEKGKEALGS